MDLSERHGNASRHPWERARMALVLRTLRRAGLPQGELRVLDVGAGDGYVAQALLQAEPNATVTCWDNGYSPADAAALHTLGLRTSTAAPEGTFDLILMLDVIEHVDDDVGLMQAALARAAPNARVLVTVPAWPRLWSRHDTALRHKRRYTARTLRASLEAAGLTVLSSGAWFHMLTLARAVEVLRERRSARADVHAPPNGVGVWRGGDAMSKAIAFALEVESAALDAVPLVRALPGLSLWALCQVAPR